MCKDKDSALHYASAQGNIDCAQALAAAGCALELRDRDNERPVDVAQDGKTKKAIELLVAQRG